MSSTNPNNNTQQRIFLKKSKNTFHALCSKICKNVISLFSEITLIYAMILLIKDSCAHQPTAGRTIVCSSNN
ncbi:hypothetical protein EfmAA96_24500 [Enterococcus faecium]|nr:hypothetical protein EfmAA96_24500 [Enterococcus faecium]